jgi:predicted amidohydrolase
MKKFKLAVCQNKPVRDKAASITHALEMAEEASGNGAEFVVFPEIFYHPYELKKIPLLTEENGETLETLKESAKRLGVYLCAGSIAVGENGKRYNRSYLISPKGKVLLEHSKCHMFDVSFKDLRAKESAVFDAGNELKTVKTELGKVGILICYDIRFPEAARKLALDGAEILIVPAAFNNVTGPAHWDVMFRARAIENQLFTVAASPARDMKALYKAYGHSMIIDPWGAVLSKAGIHEKIIYAELDPEKLADVRGRLPLLKHRRGDIY